MYGDVPCPFGLSNFITIQNRSACTTHTLEREKNTPAPLPPRATRAAPAHPRLRPLPSSLSLAFVGAPLWDGPPTILGGLMDARDAEETLTKDYICW